MHLARDMNCSVLSVSCALTLLGLMLAIISVLALPPSESCSRNVRRLSLYGTWRTRNDADGAAPGGVSALLLVLPLPLAPLLPAALPPPPPPLRCASTSSMITRPSVVSDLLMWHASLKWRPVAWLPPCSPPWMRSLPARADARGWG
jgi:hypothetical protein